MIYTARTPNNTSLVPTAPFMARGLNLAPAKLGDVELFAKPTSNQIAYEVYRGNIEAFLHATATQNRILMGAKDYTFPDTYVPTIPLPLPKTIFSLGEEKKLSAASRATLEKAIEKMEGQSRDLQGKAGKVYLLDKPIFSAIRRTLPPLAPRNIPYVVGYASIHASKAATYIYQGIEAFLATHTYDYKGPYTPIDMSGAMTIMFPFKQGGQTTATGDDNPVPTKRYVSLAI